MITILLMTFIVFPIKVLIFLFIPGDIRKKYIPIVIKFHKDKSSKGKHPHIIIDEFDKHYLSVGLTTSPKPKDIKLNHDPLGNNKNSYMKPKGTVDRKYMYYKKGKSGTMSPGDYAKAKGIADTAKQKYLNKDK